jgi:hypothetical protein
MESKQLSNSTFITMTQTRAGSKEPVQRAIPRPLRPVIRDRPPPDFQNQDPEVEKKCCEAAPQND